MTTPKTKKPEPDFPGLTKAQARLAQRKLEAEQNDVMVTDPNTGKAKPAPVGPSIFDV
jgi:hypothetical protein